MGTELLIGGVVLVGSSVQRLAGIGFALVSVPALVLLMGAGEGVLLSNVAAGAISLAGLAATWRRVRLRSMLPLVLAAAATVPLGAWVTHRLPETALLIGMGALVTVAVALVMSGARVASLRGAGGAITAGAASGFMNSATGLGGPALSLYAVNAGWTAAEFVPNAQFYGVLVNAFSVAVKGLPTMSEPAWLIVGAGVAGGAVAGHLLANRVSEERAKSIVLLLALGGGATALLKGLFAL